MLSVYVAGGSAEIERARAAVALLETASETLPIEVVSTWIGAIEAAGTANEGLDPAVRREAARACIEEVREAGEVTARDVVGWWREYPYLLPERTAAIRIAREVLNDRALRGELMCERRPMKPGYGQGAAANVYRRAGG